MLGFSCLSPGGALVLRVQSSFSSPRGGLHLQPCGATSVPTTKLRGSKHRGTECSIMPPESLGGHSSFET